MNSMIVEGTAALKPAQSISKLKLVSNKGTRTLHSEASQAALRATFNDERCFTPETLDLSEGCGGAVKLGLLYAAGLVAMLLGLVLMTAL